VIRRIAVIGVMVLGACREKAERPATPAPPPVATTIDSANSAAPPGGATPSAPGVSLFPADRDTTRFARQTTGAATAVPSCGSAVPHITGDSIGPFRLGESIEELRRRCPRLLYGWVLISDGYTVPTVAARLGGATVTAFVSDTLPTGTLHRVELAVAGPGTVEGFGVGATLEQLQEAFGAPGASEADCVLRIWFDSRPGLAFLMKYPPAERRDCGGLSEAPLSPNLQVTSVILVER
jgi:hypothetical protein